METEYEDDDQTQESQGSEGPIPRKYVRDLEKKAKELDSLKAQVAERDRRDAVRNSGLDLNDRQVTALLATHDGEGTPDAWRETAKELGFVKEEPEVPKEVQAAHERVAKASAGAQTNPSVSAEDEYSKAQTAEEVMAIAQKHGTPTSWDNF